MKNGPTLKFLTPLDCLIIKESVLDNAYRLGSVSKSEAIIDIGGGIGDFCLYASGRFPHNDVFVFEPNTVLFLVLKGNISLNKAARIKAFNIAISNGKKLKLYVPKHKTQGSLFTPKTLINHLEQELEVLNRFPSSTTII